MSNLDVKVYSNNYISIKDFDNDIDISEGKWNSIFTFLIENSSKFYFRGNRLYNMDDDFEKTVDYLSDKLLVDRGENHFRLLFSLKQSSLIYNRNLISKLWEYYEFPSIIFLKDNSQEKALTNEYMAGSNLKEIVKSVKNICVIYRSFEQNVLWLEGDFNISQIGSTLDRSTYGFE